MQLNFLLLLQGLGTSNGKEGAEYFADLDMHKKDFVWADEVDGEAIELAFSKKKIEARKTWLRALRVCLFYSFCQSSSQIDLK